MEPIKVQIRWNFKWAVKSLKFCTFMGSICSNHIKLQLKKYRRVLSWLWRMIKSLRKADLWFQYDMRNFVNVHLMTQKSEIFTLMGSFYPKYIRFELKKIRRSYLSWKWTAMQNPYLAVLKMVWGINWTFIRALKSLKKCILTFEVSTAYLKLFKFFMWFSKPGVSFCINFAPFCNILSKT